ncbi:DUF3037 domain-containing protein [Vagococcus fluvialis]|uniref:DUF3037 domain-containing protein n=1 Tax=Vagococcus fluvialis TaxID=2738 RepID=UPI001D0A3A92|nr:DUF3037 domain-containing protein [Vagococcus fluvialis]UDM74008.1 DUF3037 domain-containing protein [Vagococcus fluvialis]
MDKREGNTRRVVWYSIIRYISDVIKGEIINVGILMNVPETGEIRFQTLNHKNSKLKISSYSQLDIKTYKVGNDYLNFLIKSVDDNNLSKGLNPSSETFIPQVNQKDLPKGFIFSDTRFAKTSNPNELFESLLVEYVGRKFLNEESGVNSMIVRKKATTIIGERTKLKEKVKSNLKIKPIKDLPKSYTIDFGYAEKKYVNLIQSAPDKLQTAYDWLERMNFFTENYDKADKILFLYNGYAESNQDRSMMQMLEYLKNKDSRIEFNNIFSDEGLLVFNNELTRIEEYAKPIEEIEKNANYGNIQLIS